MSNEQGDPIDPFDMNPNLQAFSKGLIAQRVASGNFGRIELGEQVDPPPYFKSSMAWQATPTRIHARKNSGSGSRGPFRLLPQQSWSR